MARASQDLGHHPGPGGNGRAGGPASKNTSSGLAAPAVTMPPMGVRDSPRLPPDGTCYSWDRCCSPWPSPGHCRSHPRSLDTSSPPSHRLHQCRSARRPFPDGAVPALPGRSPAKPIPRWDVHFGELDDDRKDSTATHITIRPQLGGHRQCRLAICTFHLGFSLGQPQPIDTRRRTSPDRLRLAPAPGWSERASRRPFLGRPAAGLLLQWCHVSIARVPIAGTCCPWARSSSSWPGSFNAASAPALTHHAPDAPGMAGSGPGHAQHPPSSNIHFTPEVHNARTPPRCPRPPRQHP